MHYFRACKSIIKAIIWILTVIGLLGGVAADIPGVENDPAMAGVLGFFSRALRFLLHLTVHYWDGMLLFAIVIAIVIGTLDKLALEQRQNEFDRYRKKKMGRRRRK